MVPCSAKWTLETRDHALDPIGCRTIRPLDVALSGRGDVRIGDDLDLLRDVVEDHQGVSEKKRKVRQVDLLLPASRQLFERSDHVVAEISHGSAGEAGKIWHDDGPVG